MNLDASPPGDSAAVAADASPPASAPPPHQLPLNLASDDASRPRPATSSVASPSSPSSSQDQPQGHTHGNKRRRAPSAALSNCCRTCRLRKVKCSGNPQNGPCTNCARLKLDCPFAPDAKVDDGERIVTSRVKPSKSHTEAGTLRKRAQRACSQCHAQKTKCSGDLPMCKRCEAAGLACEYTATKRRSADVRLDARSAGAAAEGARVGGGTLGSNTSAGTASTFRRLAATGATVAQPPPPPPITTTAAPALASVSPKGPSVSPSAGAGSFAPPAAAEVVAAGMGEDNFILAIDTSLLTAQDLLNRKNFIMRHLGTYFDYIYWLPCMGFFHPATAYRQLEDGTFDPPTAAGVCAIASLFAGQTDDFRDFGHRCADEIDLYVFRNINRLSERVLLPYTLILSYNFIRGDFSKVWQCFGLATRLMTGLQLNWDGSASGHSQGGEARTFQQQESMRRVAWHIFTMDRFLAEGYDEYLSCPTENMRIRLPCNEDAFWEDRPVTAPRLTDKSPKPRDMGLHALNVRMVDLHYRIKRWTKMLESSDGTVEPSKIMGGLNALQNELTHFHTLLPDDMRLSDHSVMKYMALPERSSYTFLHSRISAGHIELYRFALPGILPPGRDHVLHRLPDEFVSRCRKQAVGHALCLGRLFTCIQDEADKHQARGAGSGGVFLAGDCSLPQIAGLALRVLLVAIECRIYDDLTEGSTSPLWRFQQPDEPHVLSLIEGGILRASAPFSPILMPCEKEHQASVAVFEAWKAKRLTAPQAPQPQYVPGLDAANEGHYPPPAASMQHDVKPSYPPPTRWSSRPETSGPGNFPDAFHHPTYTQQHHSEGDYGPPGLPVFLAAAQDTSTLFAQQQQQQQRPPGSQHGYHAPAAGDTMMLHDRMWAAPAGTQQQQQQYISPPPQTAPAPGAMQIDHQEGQPAQEQGQYVGADMFMNGEYAAQFGGQGFGTGSM